MPRSNRTTIQLINPEITEGDTEINGRRVADLVAIQFVRFTKRENGL